jgi:hypothetical protein
MLLLFSFSIVILFLEEVELLRACVARCILEEEGEGGAAVAADPTPTGPALNAGSSISNFEPNVTMETVAGIRPDPMEGVRQLPTMEAGAVAQDNLQIGTLR